MVEEEEEEEEEFLYHCKKDLKRPAHSRWAMAAERWSSVISWSSII